MLHTSMPLRYPRIWRSGCDDGGVGAACALKFMQQDRQVPGPSASGASSALVCASSGARGPGTGSEPGPVGHVTCQGKGLQVPGTRRPQFCSINLCAFTPPPPAQVAEWCVHRGLCSRRKGLEVGKRGKGDGGRGDGTGTSAGRAGLGGAGHAGGGGAGAAAERRRGPARAHRDTHGPGLRRRHRRQAPLLQLLRQHRQHIQVNPPFPPRPHATRTAHAVARGCTWGHGGVSRRDCAVRGRCALRPPLPRRLLRRRRLWNRSCRTDTRGRALRRGCGLLLLFCRPGR